MKNKIINQFIGAYDNRDEYQLHEIYKELAFSGILLWYLTIVLMFISLIIDAVQNTFSFATPALFVINIVYSTAIMIRIRKKRLDETDCVTLEEYEEKKKQLQKKAFIAGAQWGFKCYFLWNISFPIFQQVKLI